MTKRLVFPFTALVGQEPMKLALALNAIDPSVGGVLIRGHKGTAKSTAGRALADLLPEIEVVRGCPFACDPRRLEAHCPQCAARLEAGDELPSTHRRMRVVDLPLGATEDRVVGTLDIERAIKTGEKRFEPGVLAEANRGILYVDEVNLLDDHIVDILLDAAAMGVNVVEREGISYTHPARFILIGTMNPEEGELRPQLLDRFGLCVNVEGIADEQARVEIVRRWRRFAKDPQAFVSEWKDEQDNLRSLLVQARGIAKTVECHDEMLRLASRIAVGMGVHGHRADIATVQAAQTISAYHGRREVTKGDVKDAAELVLPHRMRRKPFEEPTVEREQIEQAARSAPQKQNHHHGPSPKDDSHAHEKPKSRSDASQDVAFETGETFRSSSMPGPKDRQSHSGRGRRVTSRTENRSGRYVKSRFPEGKTKDIAVDATLRAAAPQQMKRRGKSSKIVIASSDIREKVRERKVGTLILFVIDASGSMGANRRMAEAKGAVLSLVTEAYEKRDRVGLVAFKRDRAELVLEPTDNVELARERLADIPVGGRTPLALGITKGLEVLRRERVRRPKTLSLLVLVTDGRANASMGEDGVREELRRVCAQSEDTKTKRVVIDTEAGLVRMGAAQEIAAWLGADCIPLANLKADEVVRIVRRASLNP